MSLPYSIDSREHVDKMFYKLRKKNKKQLETINKKIIEISENPYKFKPLHPPMQDQRRVHIGSFVLTYSINEATHTVTIEDCAHHDTVYG